MVHIHGSGSQPARSTEEDKGVRVLCFMVCSYEVSQCMLQEKHSSLLSLFQGLA